MNISRIHEASFGKLSIIVNTSITSNTRSIYEIAPADGMRQSSFTDKKLGVDLVRRKHCFDDHHHQSPTPVESCPTGLQEILLPALGGIVSQRSTVEWRTCEDRVLAIAFLFCSLRSLFPNEEIFNRELCAGRLTRAEFRLGNSLLSRIFLF